MTLKNYLNFWKMKIIQQNNKNIKEIITALKNGAVLVLPTDTVYGLVCDASNKNAVEKIFDIKKRDKSKPLAVFVKDIEMAKEFAEINEKQEGILKESWPGAVTFVLPAKPGLASLVYKENTIAMRAPDYDLIFKILEEFGRPLAQTSANISGQPATTKIGEVIRQFEVIATSDVAILVVDAGNLLENKPSKVVDLTTSGGEVLRY